MIDDNFIILSMYNLPSLFQHLIKENNNVLTNIFNIFFQYNFFIIEFFIKLNILNKLDASPSTAV